MTKGLRFHPRPKDRGLLASPLQPHKLNVWEHRVGRSGSAVDFWCLCPTETLVTIHHAEERWDSCTPDRVQSARVA